MSTAPGTVARAAVQILYTNVDRVVDGRETSGWQLMACEPAVAPDLRDRLLAHVQPELDLVVPLPDFPTPQEEAAADRRLTQVLTADGTVLAHTAPAGPDTTGRANTMSHLVLLEAQEAPQHMSMDLWRSPAWCTPVGADAVRQARVSSPDAFVPGGMVTEESVAAFITQAGCGPLLAYMADLLEERLRARVAGEAVQAPVLVLPVQSTDEAALWFGALQRTCAPATGRLLGLATFARAASSLEVDAVASSGLDLVCVPATDRLDLVSQNPRVVLVTAQAAAQHTLTTAWGELVAAMTRDLGTWTGARSAMTDLLSFLADHTDLSPAWPLAMVEASDAATLGAASSGLATAVDLELVACQPAGLRTAGYLSSLVTERILGASQSDPAHWWSKLSVAPRSVPATGVLGGLAAKYLSSASQDAAWLLRGEHDGDEDAVRCLRQWSVSEDGRQALGALAAQLPATLAAAGASSERELLAAVGNLLRDGVVLDEATAARLLAPAAATLMTDQAAALLDEAVPIELRHHLSVLVEDLLVGEYRFHAVTSLAAAVSSWLAPAVSTSTPHLALEVAASRLAATSSPAREAELWRQAMDTVATQEGVMIGTAPDLAERLAQYLPAASMSTWQQVWQGWIDVAARNALYHAQETEGAVLAGQVLVAKNHPPTAPLSMSYAYVSPPTAAATLAWLHSQPLLAADPSAAVQWAASTLLCAHSLRRHGEQVAGAPAVRDELDRALVVLSLGAVQGLRPTLPRDLSLIGQDLRRRSQELLTALATSPGTLTHGVQAGLGPLASGALQVLADAENLRAVAEQAPQLHQRAQASAAAVEASRSLLEAIVVDPVALAKAALRCQVGALGQGGVDAAHAVLRASHTDFGIEGIEAWCDKQVLGIAPRGLRGLFQRR